MAFIFPEDKNDFKAPNGVTYSWDGTKWVTKTYNGAEADVRLPYRLGTDKAARSARSGEPAVELVDAEDNFSNVKFFGVNGIQIESRIDGIQIDGSELIGGDVDLTKYATIDYSDAEDQKLQNQIDELGITKGKVARYSPTSISGGFASRPGEVAFNSGDPSAVNQISFGTEDSDGVLTKPMADGDIVEFVDATAGNVSRYRITDASGAPTAVEVEYISGDNTFAVGQEEQVYIYPQNASGASKDYVDAQDGLKLNLTGGTLTNALAFNRGNKASPQFGIEPNSGTSDTNIYVFNDGQMRLRSSSTSSIDDRVGSHIVLDPNGGVPLTKIYNVVEPTNNAMAANKLYVDTIASGKHMPPGLRFDYVRSETAIAGQLAYFEDAGGLRMRLHKTSKDITWNQGGPEADVNYNEGHMFTIYNIGSNGDWNIIRNGTINRIDWHDVDILCYISHHQTNGAFSTSTNYYVTIAGIC